MKKRNEFKHAALKGSRSLDSNGKRRNSVNAALWQRHFATTIEEKYQSCAMAASICSQKKKNVIGCALAALSDLHKKKTGK
jgi:hypothetical protein